MANSYRSASKLSIVVLAFLAFQMLGSLLFIVFSLTRLLHPDLSMTTGVPKSISSFFYAFGLVALFETISRAVVIVLFLVWEYRAYSNLLPLRARRLEFSPAWAIGLWFIPFANLVQPYRVMSELWRQSDPASGEDRGSVASIAAAPAVLGFWWALFLVATAFDVILNRTPLTSEYFPVVLIIAAIVSLSAAGLLMFLVRDITRRQDERSQGMIVLWSEMPPPPPVFNPTF